MQERPRPEDESSPKQFEAPDPLSEPIVEPWAPVGRATWPEPPKRRPRTGLIIIGTVVGTIAVIAIVTSTMERGTTSASSTTSSMAPPPDGGTFSDVSTLLDALAAHKLPCTDASTVPNPSQPGAIALTDCTGATAGDTAISIFDTHADAEAAAQNLANGGMLSNGAYILVGENWLLNTNSGNYGTSAQAALGGQAVIVPTSAPTSQLAAPSLIQPAKTVVLKQSGNGISNTKSFTVGDDWSLAYTFDCSSFGDQGNFQIYEDYPSGDALVNELAKSGTDVTYQHGDAGTHSLKVNSECSWTVTVTDGDNGQ